MYKVEICKDVNTEETNHSRVICWQGEFVGEPASDPQSPSPKLVNDLEITVP